MTRSGRRNERAPRADFDRAFSAIASVVFVITFLKGFRMPNAWAATHFGFNYSQGFVRRGLVGEVARLLGGDDVYRYNGFAAVAFTVLIAVAVGLGVAIHRALRADPDDDGFRATVVAFGASPALVFLVHSVGYFEYLAVLFLLPLVLYGKRLPGRYSIYPCILGLGVVFAFIHEALVIMFGPVMVFLMTCHVVRRWQAGTETRATVAIQGALTGCVAAALLIVSLLVSARGQGDAQRIRALELFLRQHADFPLRAEAFQALGRSSKEAFTKVMPWYWSVDFNRQLAIKTWIAYLPGFAFLLYYGIRAMRRPGLSRRLTALLWFLFVVATLGPHALNFVGWDWNRWNAITLLAGMLCILSLKLYLPHETPPKTPVHVWTLGVIAAALGLASNYQLNDGFLVQYYPFDAQLETIKQLFEGGFQFRPPR